MRELRNQPVWPASKKKTAQHTRDRLKMITFEFSFRSSWVGLVAVQIEISHTAIGGDPQYEVSLKCVSEIRERRNRR